MGRNNHILKNRTLEEKRGLILATAWALYLRHGFRKVSVEDIASGTGISKGAVYLYFASKEAIFIEVIRENLKAPFAEARRIAALDTLPVAEKLLQVLRVKIGYHHASVYSATLGGQLIEDTYHLAGALIEQDMKEYQALLVTIIRAADKRGEIALKKHPVGATELAALLILSAHGMARQGEKVEAPAVFDKRLRLLIELAIGALRPAAAGAR